MTQPASQKQKPVFSANGQMRTPIGTRYHTSCEIDSLRQKAKEDSALAMALEMRDGQDVHPLVAELRAKAAKNATADTKAAF